MEGPGTHHHLQMEIYLCEINWGSTVAHGVPPHISQSRAHSQHEFLPICFIITTGGEARSALTSAEHSYRHIGVCKRRRTQSPVQSHPSLSAGSSLVGWELDGLYSQIRGGGWACCFLLIVFYGHC